MSIFNPPTRITPSQQLADGFLKLANQQFEVQLEQAYDAIQSFWYRNKDANGNPSAVKVDGVSDEPTGPEILADMGTAAGAVMTIAYARVQMLLAIQQALGINVVDLAKVQAPYTMTFNDDGSLASATLRE